MKLSCNSVIRKGIGAGVAALLLSAGHSYAHYPWINVVDYTPETGTAVKLTIGWGHRYPFDGFLQTNELASIYAVGHDGRKTIVPTSAVEYQSEAVMSEDGVYVIAAERKPGFYTKTTKGGKRSSKKGIPADTVIESSHSIMCMKAVVNVGDGKGEVDAPVGHALEIVPQVNPVALRAGDYLPVTVLLKGKPFQGTLHATYMGFSTEKDTFAYATSTDSKGAGRIKILNAGVWMIKVRHEEPYPDPSESDKESYVATLTFEVK